MGRQRGALLCASALALLPASGSWAQTDTLSAAHNALKAKDLANAVTLHRKYQQENPNAPDAAKEALHLAFILNAAKATSLDVRAAFQAVRDKHPNSDEAKEALFRMGMLRIREKDHEAAKALFQGVLKEDPKSAAASRARFPLANYQIKAARLDDAIDLFAQVAQDARIEPAMQDEALLQTGFLHIQKYFAPRLVLRNGQPAPPPTGESQIALLEEARTRLERIADELGRRTEDLAVHQTAAAYAECGIGEIYLLEGLPGRAEIWYRRAASRETTLVQAPVRTMALEGLGIALYGVKRLVEAEQALDSAVKTGATGTVLYGLLVPDYLIPQAKLWQATVAHRLGRHEQAARLAQESLDHFGGQEPANPDAREVWLASTRCVQDAEVVLAQLFGEGPRPGLDRAAQTPVRSKEPTSVMVASTEPVRDANPPADAKGGAE